MPWKLVVFLCTLIVCTLFIGFNLSNTCDVSFVFYTFHSVPIFVSLLFAYSAGAITVIPFFLASRKKRLSKNGKQASALSGSRKKGSAGVAGRADFSGNTGTSARKGQGSVPSRDYDID